jgi:hypothetical protein
MVQIGGARDTNLGLKVEHFQTFPHVTSKENNKWFRLMELATLIWV